MRATRVLYSLFLNLSCGNGKVNIKFHLQNSGHGILGCDALKWCGGIPTFRGSFLPPSALQMEVKRWYPTTSLQGIRNHKPQPWFGS